MDSQGGRRPHRRRRAHLDPGPPVVAGPLAVRHRQQPAGGVPQWRVGRSDEDPFLHPHGLVRGTGWCFPHGQHRDRQPGSDTGFARMSGVASASGARNAWLTGAAWRALFRDRPMIPLLFLLAILVVVSELARPGIVGPEWIGVILRAAVLLAILAGCQTLTMLTGGIDLSVGAVGSMAGFVVASFAAGAGWPTGVVVALIAAALAGFVTGIGVGV